MKAQTAESRSKKLGKEEADIPAVPGVESYIAQMLAELIKMANALKREQLSQLMQLALQEARKPVGQIKRTS